MDVCEQEYNSNDGFIRPGVRLMMHASSQLPGVIVLRVMLCARSSKYRHERGLQAKSGKYYIISDPRATRMALRQADVSLQKDGSAGQIRGFEPRVSRHNGPW